MGCASAFLRASPVLLPSPQADSLPVSPSACSCSPATGRRCWCQCLPAVLFPGQSQCRGSQRGIVSPSLSLGPRPGRELRGRHSHPPVLGLSLFCPTRLGHFVLLLLEEPDLGAGMASLAENIPIVREDPGPIQRLGPGDLSHPPGSVTPMWQALNRGGIALGLTTIRRGAMRTGFTDGGAFVSKT